MLIFAFQMETVEIVEGSLYAMKWQEDHMHSLDEMANNLSDAEWLYDYFEENKSNLSRKMQAFSALRAEAHSNH